MSVTKGRVRSQQKAKGTTRAKVKTATRAQLKKLSAATDKAKYLSTQGIANEILRRLEEAGELGLTVSMKARSRIKAATWKELLPEEYDDTRHSHSVSSQQSGSNNSSVGLIRDAMSLAASGEMDKGDPRKILIVSWNQKTGVWEIKVPASQGRLHELNPARIIESSIRDVLNQPDVKTRKKYCEEIEGIKQEFQPLLRELQESLPNSIAAVNKIVEMQQNYFVEALNVGKEASPALLSYCTWERLSKELGWNVSTVRKRLSSPARVIDHEAPIIFLASTESAGDWLCKLSQSDMPWEEFSWTAVETPAGGVVTGPILIHTLACESGHLMARKKTAGIIRLIERIKELKDQVGSDGKQLSDQKLADLLMQEGYRLSGAAIGRRTVAKYRRLAGIESSRSYPKDRKPMQRGS